MDWDWEIRKSKSQSQSKSKNQWSLIGILAEGNGRYSTRDRNRFFDFSLGSISEVTAGIEYALAFDQIPANVAQDLLQNLNHAYYMIRKFKK